MELTSRNEFAADPHRVAAMLVNKEFLEQVAEATEAASYKVSAEDNHTVSERTFETPSAARKFAGAHLTIIEDVVWNPPAADGSRQGTLRGSSPGLPVSMHGTAQLKPGGTGTIVTYSGELKVNVPLVGKKLEQQAAPVISESLQVQQRVGERWLAEH